MAIKLYGLKNCDTCRKASQWLAAAGIEFEFIDLRQTPIEHKQLARWVAAQGWETCLNRRSRTWRELDPQDRTDVNTDKALALMQANPTLIKRPVLEHANGIMLGFNAEQYETTLLP